MNDSGITFLEVMLALGVTAILIGLAATSGLTYSQRSQLRGQSSLVMSALTQARDLAFEQHLCVTVDVTPQSILVNGYSVPCSPLPSTPPAPVTTSTTTFASPYVLTAFDTGNPLVFLSGGATNASGPSTMSISSNGNKRSFVVYPMIGQIREQP